MNGLFIKYLFMKGLFSGIKFVISSSIGFF